VIGSTVAIFGSNPSEPIFPKNDDFAEVRADMMTVACALASLLRFQKVKLCRYMKT
jgi:hypothetical protein